MRSDLRSIQPTANPALALSFEDAEVLGTLLSKIQHRNQLPRFLSAYEELRQLRCQDAVNEDVYKLRVITLPLGAEQEARDQAFRKLKKEHNYDELDHNTFNDIWGKDVCTSIGLVQCFSHIHIHSFDGMYIMPVKPWRTGGRVRLLY